MNSSLLRIAFTAIAAVLASCESTPSNKKETAPQPPPGPNRYLQDDSVGPQRPADNPDADKPQAPGDTPPTPPPPKTETAPVSSGNASPPAPPTNQYPYGKPVPGKKGFVTSPYDDKAGMIDVRDYAPGTKVRDPYTNKIFLVP
ncbi:MAG TPA: hypothetical protein VGH65_07145 [Verrucomicrobiaceae bacterium]|jgi:hypothetical protein